MAPTTMIPTTRHRPQSAGSPIHPAHPALARAVRAGLFGLLLGLCLSLGASSAAAQITLYTLDGENSHDLFGSVVAAVGDQNGDGYDDFAVGSHLSHTGPDYVNLYSGDGGSLIRTYTLGQSSDGLGLSLAGAGDVDRDGYDDVVIGYPGAGQAGEEPSGVRSGLIRVYSGFTGAMVLEVAGDEAGKRFGTSVAGVGDLNADNYDDLLVGAPFDSSMAEFSGKAFLISGRNGQVLNSFVGDDTARKFGTSVRPAGDVNNDGTLDMIIGTSRLPSAGWPASLGIARVISGADNSLLYQFTAQTTNNGFGSRVSGAGDFNMDGYDDLIVSALAFSNGGLSLPPECLPATQASDISSGRVRVFSGLDGSSLATFDGEADIKECLAVPERLGWSMDGGFDLNGDGFGDIILGAPTDYASGFRAGSIRIYSGATSSRLLFMAGSPGDFFGSSVAYLGDVNMDGNPDFIVGASHVDGAGVEVGRAYVITQTVGP